MSLLNKIGRGLAAYLEKPSGSIQPSTCKPELLAATMRVGDVLLVDGSSRISTAIKYLTQSTWSHAALCIADDSNSADPNCDKVTLVEADVLDGIRTIALSHYGHLHTRICRPVGLNDEEIESVVRFATAQVGYQYDMKNVFDLMRYLVQTPPVPTRWRRKMIVLGSGDPTRAICSSFIAQTFQSIRYPILPDVFFEEPDLSFEGLNTAFEKAKHTHSKASYDEVLQIRHHSSYVPRDFDLSPYFNIVKPTLNADFDPHSLEWSEYQQS
jgi:hypothetical protein